MLTAFETWAYLLSRRPQQNSWFDGAGWLDSLHFLNALWNIKELADLPPLLTIWPLRTASINQSSNGPRFRIPTKPAKHKNVWRELFVSPQSLIIVMCNTEFDIPVIYCGFQEWIFWGFTIFSILSTVVFDCLLYGSKVFGYVTDCFSPCFQAGEINASINSATSVHGFQNWRLTIRWKY